MDESTRKLEIVSACKSEKGVTDRRWQPSEKEKGRQDNERVHATVGDSEYSCESCSRSVLAVIARRSDRDDRMRDRTSGTVLCECRLAVESDGYFSEDYRLLFLLRM